MGPLEHRDVYVKWDTTGLGGDEPDTAKSYVIYVTVDPENDVENEIHELHVADQSPTPTKTCPTWKNSQETHTAPCGIFCGSNNQGYWPWDNSFRIYSKKAKEEPQEGVGREISMEEERLRVETTAVSDENEPYIYTYTPYRLSVNIVSDGADRTYREVYFYDNGRVFAVKRSFGLNPGNNIFYCPWTTETPGDHTLEVMVAEDDPVSGNNTATLDVFVEEFGTPWHR